jgi:hypothetical protein
MAVGGKGGARDVGSASAIGGGSGSVVALGLVDKWNGPKLTRLGWIG